LRIKASFHSKTIIFSCALSLLFWALNPVMPQAFALSIEDERKMGQEFLAKIRGQFVFVDDPFTNQFFNDLGNYLIKSIKTKHFPFHFYIIKNNTLNAFAAPAGHIFFYSGLIDKMDTIDMLAGVMAHEIGHTSGRHLAQRIEQSKKIGLATIAGILAGVLIGGDFAGALVTGSMAAGMQAQLHYSRNDERQADQLGFKYSTSAGFDPSGLIKALNKIEQERFGESNVPPYLLTHPTGPERMARLDAMVSNFVPGPPKKEVVRLREQFPSFKTVLKAICLDPHYAENIFNAELKKTPNAFLPHFGLGIVCMKKSEFVLAIQHFKDALKVKPGFSPALIYLGKTYHMNGQDREAISLLTKALELDRADKSTLFLLGLSYENLAQYEKAIRIFKRLASFKPVKNEVYYHLGISYGRLNRLALAHYNLGIYSKRLGEIQDAKFHFRKANDLSHNNPTLRRKIREAMEGKL
jgi:predicted Zn-dependent protease